MTFPRRSRRPDEWPTDHARAQAALSDRLDGFVEPDEDAWLEGHLAGCADCRATAAAYETQHNELRSMRDQPPIPPRDLWARTAAAIEHESRFRDQGVASGGPRRRRLFAPLFAAALVVAVVVGTLTSSRLLVDGGPTAQPSSADTAAGSVAPAPSDVAFATPIPVGQHVQWISRDQDGSYRLKEADVRAVCPNENDPCAAAAPVQDQPVDFTTEPQTVFGSRDGSQLIVVNRAGTSQSASIAVVNIAPPTPTPSPSPSHEASATPTEPASPPASAAVTPSPTPTPDPSKAPSGSPTTAASQTPTPSDSHATPTPPSSRAVRRADAFRRADADGLGHALCDPGWNRRHRQGRRPRRPVRSLLAERRLVRVHGPPVGRIERPGHLRLEGRREDGASDHHRPSLGIRVVDGP